MNKEYLARLLELHQRNELSEKQSEELDKWFQSLDNGKNLDSWISEAGGKEELSAELYRDFSANYNEARPTRRTLVLRYISIAATIIMVFSVSLYFIGKQQPEATILSKSRTSVLPIMPGKNQAILTLANGTQINLNDHKTGALISGEDLAITKTSDGELVYKAGSLEAEKAEFNTISTPQGGQYQVALSDGTHVWLNAASTLKYPTRFSGGKREVELSGEGYFEVAHNPEKPFRVISKKQTITVLGTHFNINSYNDEPFAKTTLLEGSVMVADKSSERTSLLKPGQQAILDEFDLKVKSVDIRAAVAWKNGFFRFQNEELKVIMNQIARWYNVEISYKDNFDAMRFSGYISRDKSIHQILELLGLTKSVKFKIEGRKIIVMK
ncbi:FecR family protein [Pedobacter sp. V48]|uniref:FecR family protein n=1 Tax=Pedobacter sp. V48 TaxID=509635 RepID=UPI0003E49922|nr:FecR family protein [Pedobacter sp. V48]ETZ19214.1 hypothetical protein N824_10760 [Pedobacter sp. V48]